MRPASVRWCLALLDGLEGVLDEHARFDPHDHDHQRGDLVDVLDRARSYYRGLLR